MIKILIRNTFLEDLEQLPALYKEGFGKDTDIDLMYRTFNRLLNNDDYLFYSAVLPNGKLVGYMSVIINHDIVEQCKDFATIWNIRTKKEYRKQKIATRMLEHIEKQLKEKNIDFIALITGLDNTPAQKLYESMQYVEEKGYFKKI